MPSKSLQTAADSPHRCIHWRHSTCLEPAWPHQCTGLIIKPDSQRCHATTQQQTAASNRRGLKNVRQAEPLTLDLCWQGRKLQWRLRLLWSMQWLHISLTLLVAVRQGILALSSGQAAIQHLLVSRVLNVTCSNDGCMPCCKSLPNRPACFQNIYGRGCYSMQPMVLSHDEHCGRGCA